jgi:hypothetical protein
MEEEMTEYVPDNWAIIHIKSEDEHYRVLAGWTGVHLNADQWRLNSGITTVREDDECYYFDGYSGSVYKCFKDSEQVRNNTYHIWTQLSNLHGDKVEIVKAKDIQLGAANED